MKLGDVGGIRANISELADEDDALIRLHEILFQTPGTATTRKRKILDWKGKKESDAQLLTSIAATPIYTIVKEICVMLEVEVLDDRAATQAALAAFLADPALRRPSQGEGEDLQEEASGGALKGRKKRSKNRTAEEREQDRVAMLSRPRGKPGRKLGGRNNPNIPKKEVDPEIGRGRPRKYDEELAFRNFVEKNFPNIHAEWRELSQSQQQQYWVRYLPPKSVSGDNSAS